MPILNPTTQLYKIPNLIGGLNTFDSPDDIQDIEVANIRNMVFDDGILQNRKGSLLNLAKPTGETSNPFQLLVATNSAGIDYGIANYGTNFYLKDEINNQWVKLNQAYTPATGGVFYGSTSWNNGTTDDRFYFGDGVTDVMKWIMAVNTLSVATTAIDATITLTNSKSFPATGNVIIQNGLTQIVKAYTANDTTTGIITLTGAIGAIVPVGSTVTVPIQDVANADSGIPRASVFVKSFGRLFTANSVGAENTLHYSIVGNPEDHTVSASINSGGFYTVYKGKGGILGMTDYGQFLTIEKIDVISEFTFNNASDNSGFIVQVFPLISGDGIGPANNSEILNYMNLLYYPTVGEGIVSFSPSQTGTSTGSGLNILSNKINNLLTELLDFSISRTCGFAQKLYWLVSLPTIGVPTNVNNLVLMYDLVRAGKNTTLSAWTIFDNWNAVDIKPINQVLYYLSANDGGLYQTYEGYQDAVSSNPNPYISFVQSKRYDLNSPATLIRGQYIYIEGFISKNTKLYAQTLYNENGALGSQSYQILGNNSTITSNSFSGGLGRFTLASPLLGGLDLATIQQLQNPLFFRCYLEVSQAYREHNVQVNFFTVDLGAQWGISKLTLITQPEQSIETNLVLGPASVPVVNL